MHPYAITDPLMSRERGESGSCKMPAPEGDAGYEITEPPPVGPEIRYDDFMKPAAQRKTGPMRAHQVRELTLSHI